MDSLKIRKFKNEDAEEVFFDALIKELSKQIYLDFLVR